MINFGGWRAAPLPKIGPAETGSQSPSENLKNTSSQNQRNELQVLAHRVQHVSALYASVNAATPGKFLPSKSSKEAPPPVLQCVTLSSVPYFLHAVAVSPPPMTVITPAPVAVTTASINSLVPDSKLAISNTPIGPFQMMVLDS